MYKIKTLNKISTVGLAKFDDTKYKYSDDIQDPDAIMVRSASMHEMELPESLLAIARAGAGVNNIPLEKCSEKGIVVFNTPGANANAVKELVICALFLTSRKIVKGIEWCKTIKNDDNVSKSIEKGKSAFAGPEIKGKTLGVVGLGAIGRLVANAAAALGMKVYGYDPFLNEAMAESLDKSVSTVDDVNQIFAMSDYITLHVPLTNDTKEMISAKNIDRMKDNVRILNFARGDLVNSQDIINALDSGKMAAYITDFPSEDLIGTNGVIAVPHLGASTPESEENCASMGAQELIDFLEDGNIVNSVNMPAVSSTRRGSARITAIHKNQPNIIKNLTDMISKEDVNIENIVDKTRGDYGYSIIDISGQTSLIDVSEIENAEGIIKVRLI